MISEEKVEAALTYLRSSAEPAAQARAEYLYLAEWLKTVRAQVKLKQAGMSNAAAEDVALASTEFSDALTAFREAAQADATYRFKREAAAAVIEAWRTEQASLRAEGKAYG
jgi:hypothetical protein